MMNSITSVTVSYSTLKATKTSSKKEITKVITKQNSIHSAVMTNMTGPVRMQKIFLQRECPLP